MKAKSIKSILYKKFSEFTTSITDERVRKLVEKNSLITGGAIASMLLNEKVNDYDVYFTNAETAQQVANYYLTQFNAVSGVKDAKVVVEDGRVMFSGEGLGANVGVRMDSDDPEDTGAQEAIDAVPATGEYKVLFISPNAITLSDHIQIIIRFVGNAEEIHKNYDFAHCTNYWTSADSELTLRPIALECLLTKELRYVGSKYPLCSIIRTRKFIGRGWRINAGQYLKMALQLNELNLFDVKVLQDQLIGVDSAHFINLIAKIKEGDPEKINSTYICEIIDRIF